MTYHVKLDQMLKPMSEPPEDDRLVLVYARNGAWMKRHYDTQDNAWNIHSHLDIGWSELPTIEEVAG